MSPDSLRLLLLLPRHLRRRRRRSSDGAVPAERRLRREAAPGAAEEVRRAGRLEQGGAHHPAGVQEVRACAEEGKGGGKGPEGNGKGRGRREAKKDSFPFRMHVSARACIRPQFGNRGFCAGLARSRKAECISAIFHHEV